METLTSVSFEEWKRRTSILFGKRNSILEIDVKYKQYKANTNSTQAAKELYDALERYLKLKGNGHWNKVGRNQDGLMETIHGELAKKFNQNEIPRFYINDLIHTRFGVLYLLSNLNINIDWLTIGLEGVSAGTGIAGAYYGTDFNNLSQNNMNYTGSTINLGLIGSEVAVSNLFDTASVGTELSTIITGDTGTTTPREPPPISFLVNRAELPGFPLTKRTFDVLSGRYEAINFISLIPHVAIGRLGLDIYHNLYVIVKKAFEGFLEWLQRKVLANPYWGWTISGKIIKCITNIVVSHVFKAAAPFVKAGMDIGTGIIQTFNAAKTRLDAYFMRRKITLNPGHPELLANAIEGNMKNGIFSGLWLALKGVGSTALQAFLPGAGSLVATIMTGIEWAIKFIYRLIEVTNIDRFLEKSRSVFKEEPRDPYNPFAPAKSGGIVHDLPKFKEFYTEGCNISPLIPMLTLNTGICGSLQHLLKMFDDTKEHNVISQETFNTGEKYFTALKLHSRSYLQNSGFKFTSTNQYVQPLLNHALHNHNAISPDKALDKMLTLAGA